MQGGNDMYLKFWGTRGSIPKPGANTVRYGGNTSCIELRSKKGTLIVIDCGTGGHALGLNLTSMNASPSRGHMLISHTHWDHIQGIPFFAPFFVPGAEWDIYGPKNLSQSIQEALAGQMQHMYFPVTITQLGAAIRYHSLVEGSFEIDDIKIIAHYLNHPTLTCGYRIEVDGVVVVYSCDHEPYSHLPATFTDEITGQDQQHIEFLADADLVIHDAQYTLKEYENKIGWGHSPIEYAVKACQQAGVKRLALTHHDPLRDDAAIDDLLNTIHKKLKKEGSSLEVFAAAEGQEMQLTPAYNHHKPSLDEQLSADILSDSTLSTQLVLIYAPDIKMSSILAEAVKTKGIQAKFISHVDDIRKQVLADKPALVIVQHNPPSINGLDICRAIRHDLHDADNALPMVIMAAKEDLSAGEKAGVTDWLVTPFTSSYARSKIQAWILRIACRWVRPSIPANEEERLASLYKLEILDTESEERFNRITRVAAALFNVPIALISFIDKDRQWFKSCYGANAKETSREVSFCGHVIHSQETMVVFDTLEDDRFADHPSVISEPRIRFYAGCPLILNDGNCVGTLCCLDVKPRVLAKKEIRLLQDLRDITINELYVKTK